MIMIIGRLKTLYLKNGPTQEYLTKLKYMTLGKKNWCEILDSRMVNRCKHINPISL